MCEDTCRGCDALLPEHDDDHRGRCRIWCSQACRNRHVPSREPKPKAAGECALCGAPFLSQLSTRKFCSLKCGEIFRGVRRAEPLASITCALPGCETVFTPVKPTQRCCCEQHGKNLYNRESRADGRQAPQPWNDRRREAYHRRRALKKGASTGELVVLSDIAERDGHRCGICGKKVGAAAWPHPMSASLDHMIPLSQGGAHDPSNVQLAHLRCNIAKGNRGGNEQLFLIG